MVLLITLFTIAMAWVVIFPQNARSVIRFLKQRLRQRVIQQTGRRKASTLVSRFRSWADEEGYDSGLVEEVLDQHLPLIIERLGQRRANEILG